MVGWVDGRDKVTKNLKMLTESNLQTRMGGYGLIGSGQM